MALNKDPIKMPLSECTVANRGTPGSGRLSPNYKGPKVNSL